MKQLERQELDRENLRAGIVSALGAYVMWGVLPLYWKGLQTVPALELLSHRIFWACWFGLALVVLGKNVRSFGREVRILAAERSKAALQVIAALLLSVNWLVYIWAVNQGRIVECSLGYYINPLFSILLGIVFLGERLSFWQSVAVGLAGVGVANLTLQFGGVPWVALSLAASFGFYGLCKKKIQVSAVTGTVIETILVMPAAVAYLAWLALTEQGAWNLTDIRTSLLLAGTGVVTAVPLILFARGANYLPLKMLGFIQYLSPSISLCIGVFLYKETFTAVHAFSFGCIWLALVLVSLAGTKPLQRWEERLNQKVWGGKRC
ncbi:MAG TPA: EamA family transporter RarD [Patescibacteria group bacterium]|nr:EamA family transporter RarD [Patescibacteria group bacterium]